MPMLRRRGGTKTPASGEVTTRPPILIVPPVGCSRPATQRSVVVLPQPEGPSRTTISPAGTTKLTPSIAGRPTENCLRSSLTSSVAVIVRGPRSLAIAEDLVPFCDPRPVQFYIVVELRKPDLDDLWIEAFGVCRRNLQRGQIAELLDHEG